VDPKLFFFRIRIPFSAELWIRIRILLVKSFGSSFGPDPKHSLFHNVNDFKWLFIDLKSKFFKENVRLMYFYCHSYQIANFFWWFLVRFKSSFGSESGSGSCKKFRILADPDPQHWYEQHFAAKKEVLKRSFIQFVDCKYPAVGTKRSSTPLFLRCALNISTHEKTTTQKGYFSLLLHRNIFKILKSALERLHWPEKNSYDS
jgi:hypothetical protein